MKIKYLLNALLLALLATAAIARSEVAPPATEVAAPALEKTGVVTIESGQLSGLIVDPAANIAAYKGIPFAAPPVGENRWRAPQPVQPWEGVRECNAYGNASLQVVSKLPINVPGFELNAPVSEDCLYLNVWSPNKSDAEKLPVMVWIHGGGYTIGAASQPLYDGLSLAQQGVVVVTVNYRLGALGFMGHSALSEESGHKASGNYGIMDQIAALRWVKRNIANFGGDAGNVTIFGESAGGGSVFSLLVSPQAKGLFHRAIAQSGPIMNLKHITKQHGRFPSLESVGDEVVAKLGLSDKKGPELLTALRTLPAEQIVEATNVSIASLSMNVREDLLRWAPIVDGYIIPDRPNKLIATGKFNQVPVMIGSNKDEGTMFTMLANPVKTPEDFDKMLTDAAPEHVETLRKHYPASNQQEMKASLNAVVRNLIFTLQARSAARLAAKAGVPAYLYQFTFASPAGLGKMMGAHHGAEIPYVFGSLASMRNPSDTDRALAETVSGYVVAFAKTGDPNHDSAPVWPKYSPNDDAHMEWGEHIKPTNELYREQLDLLEKVSASIAGE